MIKEINFSDKEYPQELLKIKKYPKKLFVKGNVNLLNNKCIAIVGSRNASEYGLKVAKEFAKELSKNNITVVSGLALGIDASAHLGALNEIGSTIAVIGSGFNYMYPEENEYLYDKILDNNGLIITEYNINVEPAPKNFPERNRIISGIAKSVLIVEAANKSGSLITAKLAKEQNKKIFCIPNSIYNKHGYGTNQLIKEGKAELVDNVDEILKYYDIDANNLIKVEKIAQPIVIKEEYKPIYKLISNNPTNINLIYKQCNLTIPKVNYILTMLEIEGLISELPGKEFVRNYM